MPDIELHFPDARQAQCIKHEALHLEIAFQAAMAIQFRANLQRLAGAHQAGWLGVQHAARIAQAGDALAVEQVRIYARHLGSRIGA